MKPVIVPSSIALALGVSVGIGLFFGSLPATEPPGCAPSTPYVTSERHMNERSEFIIKHSPRSAPGAKRGRR